LRDQEARILSAQCALLIAPYARCIEVGLVKQKPEKRLPSSMRSSTGDFREEDS
jgi:hypothetical protein